MIYSIHKTDGQTPAPEPSHFLPRKSKKMVKRSADSEQANATNPSADIASSKRKDFIGADIQPTSTTTLENDIEMGEFEDAYEDELEEEEIIMNEDDDDDEDDDGERGAIVTNLMISPQQTDMLLEQENEEMGGRTTKNLDDEEEEQQEKIRVGSLGRWLAD